MELIALRTFRAVVEEGGFLAASRRLNTVQSNVTARIKRLEEEFGTALFFRKGRALELSPSGRVLLDYASRMLQLEQQTNAALRQAGEEAGELRIGTMETFAAVHLPNALKSVKAAHPGLELQVCTDTSEALIDNVLAHRLDCAFVGGPVEHADLESTTVVEEELVLVHTRGQVPPSSALILFREGCAYRSRALQWQRECGQPFPKIMEMGTLDGILGCVAVGLGSTLAPRRIIEQSRYAGEFAVETLPERIARVPTVMIRHRLTPALKSFDTLRRALAGWTDRQEAQLIQAQR